jgi:flagellar hook-associated protein 3 FlgL
MYYDVQNSNANNVGTKLFDVNKQISSGNKFEYAYENPTSFADTLRLDSEINTFNQVATSTSSGLKFSQQTDSTISSITNTMDQLKTKLIQAASGSNSPDSMAALAGEMRGLETQLKSLANTSINGKYIFSGSSVNQKPIDDNGNYLGNDQVMTSFLGSNVRQSYNIPGSDLFLGDESTISRRITTNIPLLDQSALHPEVMNDTEIPDGSGVEKYITTESTIRDMMGDNDTVVNTTDSQNHFYISGTNHDGSTFKTTINMKDNESVGDLLDKVGKAFGNTSTSQVVSVTLNEHGQIEIQDKLPGSSKLDFHMVGNIDTNGPVNNLDTLNSNKTHVVNFTESQYSSYTQTIGQQKDLYSSDGYFLNMTLRTKTGDLASGTTKLTDIFPSNTAKISFGGKDANGTAISLGTNFAVTSTSTVGDLMSAIKTAYSGSATDFSINMTNGKINFSSATGTTNGLDISLTSLNSSDVAVAGITSNEGISYDNSAFLKNANMLTSNVSQIVRADNSYATMSTKLSDISAANPLNGTTLSFNGTNISGSVFSATINLVATSATAPYGSNFTVTNALGTTTTYPILDATGNPTNGNNVTYKQLTDSINMVMSGNLPDATKTASYIAGSTTTTKSDYADAYNTAIIDSNSQTSTTLDTKGQIAFKDTTATSTKASMTLNDANSTDLTASASALQFNSNSALAISDPKTDFFARIDEIISSVEQGKYRADFSTGDPRNVGIQNAIQMIDDLNSHIAKEQSKSGVQSQSLQAAGDRTQALILSAKTLRSSVADTDIAQATLQMTQLQLTYQAIYSTISKVSQLSLVKYL